ncbi:hypothetical protein QUA56_21600 [Microcoleus sp. N3A4]|uniref:hypothetical protein n=1 Tax=Microcoleus sp. N3A4 TaxID=3055379 RepID=UPI002FD6454E
MVCQFKGWNAQTLDRPKTVNNMKEKPTLGSKVGSVHASLPTARQSGLLAGRRKSREKDPNVRKNLSPTIKLQFTQPDLENFARSDFPLTSGNTGASTFQETSAKKLVLGRQDAQRLLRTRIKIVREVS